MQMSLRRHSEKSLFIDLAVVKIPSDFQKCDARKVIKLILELELS